MKKFIIVTLFMLMGCNNTDNATEFAGSNEKETEIATAVPYENTVKPNETNWPAIDEEVVEEPMESEKPELIEPRVQEEGEVQERRTEEIEEIEEEVVEPEEEVIEEEVEEEIIEEVDEEEQAKIDSLRTAIFAGLDIGRYVYLEEVSLQLQNMGIIANYEESFVPEWVMMESEDCPFAKYYDNKPDVNYAACEYMLDAAKADVYAELVDLLDSLPMPSEIEEQYMEEAMFWMEQGAISGIEENRVMIRNDLKINNICNQTPTAVESSFDKGLIEGRQHFITHFNTWLDKNGYIPDYPAMSQPIEVCNADISMLDPARKDALKSISKAMEENPLCEDYEPNTLEAQAQYAQAQIDYSEALKQGIENEYSLAAVKVFKVIPCNVSDPLIIDLNGNGIFDITTIQGGVNFDLHTPGRKQAMAWTNGDGFLFLDRNGNGIADSGLEFFGNQTEFRDGFEHIRIYDDNKDNFLTKEDEKYNSIYIWSDFDMDGVCTSNEVASLEEFSIDAISVVGVDVDINTPGGKIEYVSLAFADHTAALLVGDVFLRNAAYAKLEK